MLKPHQYLAGLSCLFLSSTVVAAPVISTISNQLTLTASALLQDSAGVTASFEHSYSGSILSGDHDVYAIDEWLYSQESRTSGTVYEEFSVVANANTRTNGSGFNLWAESDKYPTGLDQDAPPDAFYTSIGLTAMAAVSWRFAVSGGDVDINYYVADEHVRGQAVYPSGWTDSLASLVIFDETAGTEVLNVAGWVTSGYMSLLDGHTYAVQALARDDHSPGRYLNEEDVDTGLYFSGATFISVGEPSLLMLSCIGLLLLGANRLPSRLLGIRH